MSHLRNILYIKGTYVMVVLDLRDLLQTLHTNLNMLEVKGQAPCHLKGFL